MQLTPAQTKALEQIRAIGGCFTRGDLESVTFATLNALCSKKLIKIQYSKIIETCGYKRNKFGDGYDAHTTKYPIVIYALAEIHSADTSYTA